MRINNQSISIPHNFSTQKVAHDSQFSSILKAKTEAQQSSKKTDSYDVRTSGYSYGVPQLMYPDEYTPVRRTGTLTEDDKLALQEKYDFDTMKYDSEEYHSLMYDLYQLGVISHIPLSLPLGIESYTVDSTGRLTSMMVKVEDEEREVNLEDWFANVLTKYGKRYQKAVSQSNPPDVEKLFSVQYETDNAIRGILNTLF